VFENEGRRRKGKIWLVLYVDGLARAVPRFWNMMVGFGRVKHSRAKLLVMLGLIFFLFSYHIWTNTYKTN